MPKIWENKKKKVVQVRSPSGDGDLEELTTVRGGESQYPESVGKVLPRGFSIISKLRIIDLSCNRIGPKLHNLALLRNLRKLVLPYNRIKYLDGLQQMWGEEYRLEYLDMRDNLVADMEQLLFFSGLRRITELKVAPNPVCTGFAESRLHGSESRLHGIESCSELSHGPSLGKPYSFASEESRRVCNIDQATGSSSNNKDIITITGQQGLRNDINSHRIAIIQQGSLNYRIAIIQLSPSMQKLDSVIISESERKNALSYPLLMLNISKKSGRDHHDHVKSSSSSSSSKFVGGGGSDVFRDQSRSRDGVKNAGEEIYLQQQQQQPCSLKKKKPIPVDRLEEIKGEFREETPETLGELGHELRIEALERKIGSVTKSKKHQKYNPYAYGISTTTNLLKGFCPSSSSTNHNPQFENVEYYSGKFENVVPERGATTVPPPVVKSQQEEDRLRNYCTKQPGTIVLKNPPSTSDDSNDVVMGQRDRVEEDSSSSSIDLLQPNRDDLGFLQQKNSPIISLAVGRVVKGNIDEKLARDLLKIDKEFQKREKQRIELEKKFLETKKECENAEFESKELRKRLDIADERMRACEEEKTELFERLMVPKKSVAVETDTSVVVNDEYLQVLTKGFLFYYIFF